jgi:hypothetical protein
MYAGEVDNFLAQVRIAGRHDAACKTEFHGQTFSPIQWRTCVEFNGMYLDKLGMMISKPSLLRQCCSVSWPAVWGDSVLFSASFHSSVVRSVTMFEKIPQYRAI